MALHALAICGLWWLPEASPVQAPGPEVIQVVLGPEPSQSEEPRSFTELPRDRADSRPDEADLLSNVTSRARDRVADGQTDFPRTQGESDASLVKLGADESPSRPSPPAPATRRSEPAEALTQSVQPGGKQPHDSPADARAESTSADRRPPEPQPPSPDDAIRVTPGTLGSSDFAQPDMDSAGGASLTGDVSLNTEAWEYAPWMERFGRQLMHRWVAPLAYSMGILKDGGWCMFEVEISRSGQILRLELVAQQEHPALTQAARDAVSSLSPLEPLPANFPEPTLVLRLRMIYPRIRAR